MSIAYFPSLFQSGFRTIDGSSLDAALATPQWGTEDQIIATAGGGQTHAYQITAPLSRVTTVTSSGDSIKLPQAMRGLLVVIMNSGSSSLQIFGQGTDTVEDAASISQSAGTAAFYFCPSNGKWYEVISGGGGGGGLATQKTISAGATDTVTSAGVMIMWNSSTASTKTETIPASTGSMGTIVISDIIGTAGAYPITAVPVSGPAIIGVNEVYTNFGSITLLDTSNGWCSI